MTLAAEAAGLRGIPTSGAVDLDGRSALLTSLVRRSTPSGARRTTASRGPLGSIAQGAGFAPPPTYRPPCPLPGASSLRPAAATRPITFHPRGFSPPRRFAPRWGRGHVAARSRQGFATSCASAPGPAGDRCARCGAHPERSSTAFARSRATSLRAEPPIPPAPKRPRAVRARAGARPCIAGTARALVGDPLLPAGRVPTPKDRRCAPPVRRGHALAPGLHPDRPPPSPDRIPGPSGARPWPPVAGAGFARSPPEGDALARPSSTHPLPVGLPPGPVAASAPARRPAPARPERRPSPEGAVLCSVRPLPAGSPTLGDLGSSACGGLVLPPSLPQGVGWQRTRMQRSRRGPRATAETVMTCRSRPKPGSACAAGRDGRSPRLPCGTGPRGSRRSGNPDVPGDR